MAFIVPTRPGSFEVRESRSTPEGPRSRTLTSFRELTDEVIEKAQAKAAKPLPAADLRRAARRAGAPVAREAIDRAARELIAELGKGRKLDPVLRHMLLDLLAKPAKAGNQLTRGENGNSVAAWMAATPQERGNALVDLLALADAIPSRGRRGKSLSFPKLDSSAHA